MRLLGAGLRPLHRRGNWAAVAADVLLLWVSTAGRWLVCRAWRTAWLRAGLLCLLLLLRLCLLLLHLWLLRLLLRRRLLLLRLLLWWRRLTRRSLGLLAGRHAVCRLVWHGTVLGVSIHHAPCNALQPLLQRGEVRVLLLCGKSKCQTS